MKIGFDAKRALNNSSGLGNYARNLLNALMQEYPEHEYLLFSPKAKDEYFNQLNGELKMMLPETRFQKSFHAAWRSFGIKSQLIKNRVELYHGLSNEIPFGITSTGIASVVTIHDLIFLKHTDQYPFIDRQIYKLKTQYAAKQADKIVAVSNQTKQDLVEIYGVAERKVEVIYPIIDSLFENQEPGTKSKEVIPEYGLPAKYVLNVGSFFARKNQATLVEAFDRIKNQIEEDLVLVGGDGNMLTEIKALIEKKGIEKRVHIITNAVNEELPIIYRRASAFVYPSLFEGFGMPIVEALFSKTPVVTTRGGCFEEAGGKSALYVNPISAAEISAAILRVLSDEKLKAEMITTGLVHAQTMSAKSIAQKMIVLYKSI